MAVVVHKQVKQSAKQPPKPAGEPLKRRALCAPALPAQVRTAPASGMMSFTAPLTSEPPLADAAPLTSEPPLAETTPLTSEPTVPVPAVGTESSGV